MKVQNQQNQKLCFLNVITGTMFAGKTDFLIKKVQEHIKKGEKVIIFKPSVDNRFAVNEVISHNRERFPAVPISNLKDILKIILAQNNYDVVAIDEAHFFNLDLIGVVDKLLENGCDVWISGLNQGFCEHNLEVMNHLLAMADNIFKLHAFCDVCQDKRASKIQLVDEKGNLLKPSQMINFVGGKEKYQVRCRICYVKFYWDDNA